LKEMRREVFAGRDGFLTVGEAPGIPPVRNEHITNPANGELDMLFLFDHVDFDCDGVKWKPLLLDLPGFKRIMAGYQTAVENVGWASLFTGNHDQQRVVSRWG
ncbi:alpha-amylase family glycosyl hydrolase, partial [Bifidobacterium breve]|uniref:alpha-amylase family glycosyl hydrolase n=1 Tax=Bifidobacterium breve TaxID=1685 RepID=UPI002433DD20